MSSSHRDLEVKYEDVRYQLTETLTALEKQRRLYNEAEDELEMLTQGKHVKKMTSRGDTSMEGD